MSTWISVAVALLSATPMASAATWYVTKEANATATGSPCTATEPCGSIQTAIDVATAGDIVKIGPGSFTEHLRFGSGAAPNTRPGITLQGSTNEDGGAPTTIVQSVRETVPRPPGVLADIIVDVWSSNVVLQDLVLVHPAGEALHRDIGVFVGPPATNFTLHHCEVRRARTVNNNTTTLEPTAPGSRGILVFRATGSVIRNSLFAGNYQDHIHNPTSDCIIQDNVVQDATRLGIVFIQETNVSDTTGNVLMNNTVTDSGGDGIQIQGDDNILRQNYIASSGGAGIKLCGLDEVGDCVNPFDAWSEASFNVLDGNTFGSDNVGGNIVDNGSNNTNILPAVTETPSTAAPSTTMPTASPTAAGIDTDGPTEAPNTIMPTEAPTSRANAILGQSGEILPVLVLATIMAISSTALEL